MAIHFRCSCCRHRVSARSSMAGLSVTCPGCRQEIQIPSAVECRRAWAEQANIMDSNLISEARIDPPATATQAVDTVRRPKPWRLVGAVAASVMLALAVQSSSLVRTDDGAFSMAAPGFVEANKIVEIVQLPPISLLEDELNEHGLESVPEPNPTANPPVAATEKPPIEVVEIVPPPAVLVDEEKKPERVAGGMKRRRNISEKVLCDNLLLTYEVGVSAAEQTQLLSLFPTHFETTAAVELEPTLLLQIRPDLALLPIQQHGKHRLSPSAAATLDVLSQKLHDLVDEATPRGRDGKRIDPANLKRILQLERRGKGLEWLRAEAIPALMQILMHEATPIRKMLVELLGEIPDHRATAALAQRAIFDLSPEARESAVTALKDRPLEQSRQVLLVALRYPWPPAADHAAEALVALKDVEAVPALVMLLREPDVDAPVRNQRGTPFLREVVRMRHSTNCLGCHAPALTNADPVAGAVPNSVMTPMTPRAYYRPEIPGTAVLVRADITYFRQDFSVALVSLLYPDPRHPGDRFDFMVRQRPLTAKQNKELLEMVATRKTYEQKESVLFALRQLTGKDPGTTYEDWLRLYPTAAEEAFARRWIDRLLQESSAQRLWTLEKMRDGKEPAFSFALMRTIPHLTETERAKAAEYLEKRLARAPSERKALVATVKAELSKKQR